MHHLAPNILREQQSWEAFAKNPDLLETDAVLSKEDLRGTRTALPPDVFFYLNTIQRVALESLENLGWKLAFIRRPLFFTPLVVLSRGVEPKYAVLEQDGSLNLSPSLKLR